ncbi:hypothetical protein Tco_1317149 [Tanacetum coccineum]
MLALRLIAESESEAAFYLLRFIQQQINESRSHDGREDEFHDDNPPPPPVPPTQQAPHTLSTIKLPILKKGEYDIWAMKMEHYLGHTDYPIWEVIQKGNGPISVSTNTNGVKKVLPPKTAKEILARERERKARTTFLMDLPEDHLAKFHKMTDAKEISLTHATSDLALRNCLLSYAAFSSFKPQEKKVKEKKRKGEFMSSKASSEPSSYSEFESSGVRTPLSPGFELSLLAFSLMLPEIQRENQSQNPLASDPTKASLSESTQASFLGVAFILACWSCSLIMSAGYFLQTYKKKDMDKVVVNGTGGRDERRGKKEGRKEMEERGRREEEIEGDRKGERPKPKNPRWEEDGEIGDDRRDRSKERGMGGDQREEREIGREAVEKTGRKKGWENRVMNGETGTGNDFEGEGKGQGKGCWKFEEKGVGEKGE